MKKLITISILALAIKVNAQFTNGTSTNFLNQPVVVPQAPPTSGNIGDDFVKFLRDFVSQSNMLYEVHGLYAKGLPKHYGGGIGAFYPVNKYLYTGLRLDYVDGGFWMPSGNVGLQLPIYPLSIFGGGFTNIETTFFGYGGIALPVSGAKIGNITVPGSVPINNNGQVTGIVGVGVAVKLWGSSSGFLLYHETSTTVDKWYVDALFDVEQWTGFPGNQYRAALAFHKLF